MAKKFLTPIQSTVSTGTAPFIVASTTTVTNLNADLLDGQQGSYYAAVSSLSNYQPIDADLTAIAALSGTSGLLKKTAANTWTLDTTAYTTNTGTVTSVGVSVPTGLSVSGTPVTSSGTIAISLQSGYSIPTMTNQTNWTTAYNDRLKWDGGATGLTASTGRTSLGATTVGSNIFTLTNPSAIRFLRINADNSVSALDASTFRTAIGAGTSSTTGTVTSISTSGAITGGTITTSGTISHSTSDGYLHVPATGTTNNGKVLTAGATAGSLSWQTPTTGTVTSVAMTVPTGLSISGSPITSSGTLAISLASGYSIPTTTSQTNWNTAYTDRLKWDGNSTGLNATTGRTSLGLGNVENTALSTWAGTTNITTIGTISTGTWQAGNILPATDNTGVVGNATNTWNNGQFTNLTIDSTLNVRAAIDLADSDYLRFGSSDDTKMWYNGSTNIMNIELEAAAVSLNITDNGTNRVVITKSSGNIESFGSISAESGTTDNITSRTKSGFWQTATATTAEGWPETTNSWYHMFAATHSNTDNYYSLQLAAPFFSNKLYFRSTNGSGTTSWSEIATVDQLGTGGLDPFFLGGM